MTIKLPSDLEGNAKENEIYIGLAKGNLQGGRKYVWSDTIPFGPRKFEIVSQDPAR